MTNDEAQGRIAELESENLNLNQRLRGSWNAQLQERCILAEAEARRLRELVVALQFEIDRLTERCRTLERAIHEGAAASLFDAKTLAERDR